ncbi:MAG: J domain-containing protein [Smithella sp.]|nr:J domain-containing protein [Smithella sp.]
MLVKRKTSVHSFPKGVCLSCGAGNIGRRRYCSIRCRQHLRQKLNTRSGLMRALNARYATFYFTDTLIVLDVVVRGVREVFRYKARRAAGVKPAEDFGKMSNRLGDAWWAEEKRTAKTYLASRRVLEMAERLALDEGLKRPRWVKVPSVKLESILLLGMVKADLAGPELHRVIKNAYRRQVKIHHPDAGGTTAAFLKIHNAYHDLLRWAEQPTFIRRRGFPDKWYYDGDHEKWVQPMPLKKG